MLYILVFILGMVAAYALSTYWATGWKWFAAAMAALFAFALTMWERGASMIGG